MLMGKWLLDASRKTDPTEPSITNQTHRSKDEGDRRMIIQNPSMEGLP